MNFQLMQEMIISIVVAASDNHVIGKDNQLLWKLPNDLKFFKNTTWAMPVVMGRKTFESMGKPLNGRTNIVITRNNEWESSGVKKVNSLEEALEVASDADAKEIYVIGGGEIYAQAMPLCKRIYLTRVHAEFSGDTFFPILPKDDWELLSELPFPSDEKHAYSYTFQVWERKSSIQKK